MAVLKYSQNNTNDLLVMLRMFVNDVHYMLIDSKQINEEYLEHINHSKEIIEELDNRNFDQRDEMMRVIKTINELKNTLVD